MRFVRSWCSFIGAFSKLLQRLKNEDYPRPLSCQPAPPTLAPPIKSLKSCRLYDGISGEPTEFEWNIFPGFTTLQLYGKVTDLLSKSGEPPETFTGRILFMSMFNDISCDKKDNEVECLANAEVVSIYAKKFGFG